MTNRTFSVRLSVENEAAFKKALSDAGLAGQVSMKKLKDETEKVPRALKAVDAAAGELRGSLEDFAATSGPVGRIAAVLGPGGLLVAAGVAGFGALLLAARNAADGIAAIGDAAERASFDAGAYEQFGAALVLVGQKTEGLEQSLSTFSRKIGEARGGVQEAERIFRALGVSLTDAAGNAKTSQQVLLDVADAVAAIPDPAQRAAAAQRLFGEQGRALVPVLQQGSEGMRALYAEAERVGLLYGGDLIRDSQALADEFGKQAAIIDTQLKAAFVELAPILTTIGDLVVWLVRNFSALFRLLASAPQAFSKTRVSLSYAQNLGWNLAQDATAWLKDQSRDGELSDQVSVTRSDLALEKSRPDQNAARIAELEARLQSLTAEQAARAAARLPPGAPTDVSPVPFTPTDLAPGGGGQKNEADNFAADIAKVNEQLEKFYLLKQANEATLLTMQEGGADAAEVEAYRQFLQAVLPLQEAYGLNFEKLTEAQRAQLEAELERARAQLPLIAQQERENAALEQAIAKREDLAKRAKSDEKEVRDFAMQTASSFGELLANIDQGTEGLKRFGLQLAEVALQGALFGEGPLGSLFGKASGDALGGLLGFLFNARGNAFAGGELTAFARGGIVDRPTLFPMRRGAGVMGEAGPEAIMPLTRMPGGRLGVEASGGGSQVVLNYAPVIDARGADAAAVARIEAQQRQMAQGFENRAVAAIQGAKKRRVKGL